MTKPALARAVPWPLSSGTPIQALILPSIGNMVFVALLFVLAFGTGQGLLSDGDTGYHIRAGEIILNTWQVPTSDPFSFHTPALPWTAHEWLSEAIMAVVFRIAGLTGIVLFFGFLLAVTHWFLYQWLRSRSNDLYLCALVTLLATATSSSHWLARPHVFSFLLIVFWCRILEGFQEGRQNYLFYSPILMLLWVNLHGGFIIGLVLIGVYLTGNAVYAITAAGNHRREYTRKAKTLSLAFLACLVACVVNPVGWEILWFPIRVVTSDRFVLDQVIEFLSPNFHDTLPFKYMFLVTIGALAFSRGGLSLIEGALLLLLSYMSLYSARHVALFAIVISPILLKTLENIVDQIPDRLLQRYRKRVGNLAEVDNNISGLLWPIASVSLVVALALAGNIRYSFDEKKVPVAAVKFLVAEPISGNMFNNEEFGDYVIFAGWPNYRVFMDGRSDMYGAKYGRDYLRVAQAQLGWKKILEKYNITTVLFDTHSPLTAALLEQSEWQPIYSDRIATVFVKKIAAHRLLLAKYPSVVVHGS